MNILLDTHIAIWAVTDDSRLSSKARDILLNASNTIFFSAVSTLEVNNKRKSKSNNLEFTTSDFVESCLDAGFIELPLLSKHFVAENNLIWNLDHEPHKDPYGRLLLAQAKSENYFLMTHDSIIPLFDEKCIISV